MSKPKTVATVVVKFCDNADAIMLSIKEMKKVCENNKELVRKLNVLEDKIGNFTLNFQKNITPILKRAKEEV